MSKSSDAIKAIHQYRYETGKTEIDMHDVAKWAVSKGWKLPQPKTPIELLAKELSKAAAQEIRHDKAGRPYRANHAVTHNQLTFWVDIDEAPRKWIHKSLNLRREQMVGDAVQLTFDAQHWNSVHPTEEPIEIPLDFAPDVEWRVNGDTNDKTGS